MRALTHTIRDAGPRAVIAVDEEGGDVTRLHARDGSPVLGAAALGAADDLGLTRVTGHAIGAELAALGITLVLGPVADVNSNAGQPRHRHPQLRLRPGTGRARTPRPG